MGSIVATLSSAVARQGSPGTSTIPGKLQAHERVTNKSQAGKITREKWERLFLRMGSAALGSVFLSSIVANHPGKVGATPVNFHLIIYFHTLIIPLNRAS